MKLSMVLPKVGDASHPNHLSFYRKVYEAVYNDKNYDIVYLDFSKLFDMVSHQRLISKIKAHGK